MHPFKIALLSRWYWEETRRNPAGGMVRQVAEAMAALGHEIVVLSQSPHAKSFETTQIGPLEVCLTPRDKKRDFLTGLRDKWAKQTYRHRKVVTDAYALGDFLQRRGPFDVLWAQCEEPDGLIAAYAAQLDIKLPPLLTQIHSLRYHFEEGIPHFIEKPALHLSFRHATRVIANSEMVARDILEPYSGSGMTPAQLQAKTYIVHPNLQNEFLQNTASHAAEKLPEIPRVLFFGALNAKKGAIDFLEAILKTTTPSIRFAVLGGFTENNPTFRAEWEKTLQRAQEVLPPERLELLGKLSADAIVHEVLRSSLVVLPSYYDEFSRALVETLIHGRPVITTDRVGACPLVRDHQCGLVVPPHDPCALAQAIDQALAPNAPYLANVLKIAPRLRHEYAPSAIARQLAFHLSEIA